MNRVATYYRHLWTQPVNLRLIALVRRGEQYVFLWDDSPANRRTIMRVIGRFASDPNLSFTWYDAARLSNEIRSMT